MSFLSREAAGGWENDVKLWYHSSVYSALCTMSGKEEKKQGRLRSQSFKLLPGDRQSGMIPIDIIRKTCFWCCWCTLRKRRSAETVHLLGGAAWAHLASRRCTVCTYTGLSGVLQGCRAVLLMWNTRAEPTRWHAEEVSTSERRSPRSTSSPRWSATQLPAEDEMPSCQCISCPTFKIWPAPNITLPDCLLLVWTPAMKRLHGGSVLFVR